MQVKRLDLGADVIYVPTRDILVIHPDLDYAEALGAVAGTLPHLHPDAVKCLVDQVTPAPRPEPKATPGSRLLRAAAGTLATAMAVFALGVEPATATAPFGEHFQASMASLGFECYEDGDADDSAQTCTDGFGDYQVQGFVQRHGTLYLLNRPAGAVCVLVFANDAAARQWAFQHPRKAQGMTDRVVTWQTHNHQRHAAAVGT